MHRIAALVLALGACGAGDPLPTDTQPAAEAAAGTQHWTPTAETPRGCAPAFPDIPAAGNDCAAVPATRSDSGLGECSVGCFGAAGSIHVAVGCHGCSAEYAVTFTP